MLLNQMHERFAQGRALGMTWRGAYRYAGYRGDSGHASRLARRPDVLMCTRELINEANALVSLSEGVLAAKVMQVEQDVRAGACGAREAEARLRALALAYRIKTEAHRRNQAIVAEVRAATRAAIWDEAGEMGTPTLDTELSALEAEEEALRLELSGLSGPPPVPGGPVPVHAGPEAVRTRSEPVPDPAAADELESQWWDENLAPLPDPDGTGLHPPPLYADRIAPASSAPAVLDAPAMEPEDPLATLAMAQSIVARQLAEAVARTDDPAPIRTSRPGPAGADRRWLPQEDPARGSGLNTLPDPSNRAARRRARRVAKASR